MSWRIAVACLWVALAIGFVFLISFHNLWEQYVNILSAADSTWLTVGICLVVGTAVAKAWRIASTLGVPLSLSLLQISMHHNLILAVLPARSGDVSLPLLLRRAGISGLSRGTGVLVSLRLYDVFLLGVFAGIAGVSFAASGEAPRILGLLLAIGGLAALVCAICLPVASQYLAQAELNLLQGWPKVLNAVREMLVPIASRNLHSLWAVWASSVLVWLLVFSTAVCVARACGVRAEWDVLVLAAIAACVAFATPFGGPANLGPYQLAWTGVLTVFGVPFEPALASGLLTPIATLAVYALLTFMLAVARRLLRTIQ